MKKILLISLILTAILLAGCGTANPEPAVEEQNNPYVLITPEELVEIMNERRESFLLVNTHVPFEGNIPTTDFSVPYYEVDKNLEQFPTDKDAEIIIYCMSNRMAYIAAAELVEAGYSNLRLLDGGMIGWQGADLPLDMTP